MTARGSHILSLIATLCVLVCPALKAEHIDDLYARFQETGGTSHIQAADAIYAVLNDEEFTDSLLHYNKSHNSKVEEAYVHYWMAEWYVAQAQYEAAIIAGNKAEKYSQGVLDGTTDRSDILAILTHAYFRNGNFDDALAGAARCYEIDRKLKDDERVSSDLNSLACIYLAAKQPKPGIEYILRAIDMERKLGDRERLAIRLGIASELYALDEQPDKAMEMIQEAYAIDRTDGRDGKAAIRQTQMAAILMQQNKPTQARPLLTQAAATLKREGITASLTICYNQLGRIEHESGNNVAAADYYNRALTLATKSGNRYLEQTAEQGLWLSLRDSDPTAAMTHLERYSAITDTLNEHLRSKQLSEFRVKYHTDELAALNDRYEKENRQLLIGGSIIAALLLAAIAALLYARHQRSKAHRLNKQLEEVRNNYFTNITHEFRSPLTVIMSAGQQLSTDDMSADRVHEQGQLIVKHGRGMLQLINRLLGVTSTVSELGEARWVNGDIVAHVRMTVDKYLAFAQQQNIELEFRAIDSPIVTDYVPDYVNIVVSNLIDNAIKYTPAQGRIAVTLQVAGDKVQLQVSDTGTGIATHDLPHIFEAGYRGDNNDGKRAGNGVGLATTRQSVEAMHGTIEAAGDSHGTTFTVTLPLPTAVTASTIATPDNTYNDNDRPLALIVEDNSELGDYLGALLRQQCNVQHADNGRQAIDKISTLLPSLVVTDLMMPDTDGYRLIEHIRSTATLRHIPVIVVTGKDDDEHRIKAIEAGADAYLVKPFNPTELQLLAERLIKRGHETTDNGTTGNYEQATTKWSEADQTFINQIVNLVHHQLANGGINTDDIAASMGLSRKRLRSRIETITGETPTNFIMRVRLSKACRMLSSTDMNVTDIAARCGFHDVAHFSRTFKLQYGLTPSQYRRQGGSTGETNTSK